MRYRFYREHKFVSAALNDLERLIARADFCSTKDLTEVQRAFSATTQMLKQHADYENARIHQLLRSKNSGLYQALEHEHAKQEKDILALAMLLDAIEREPAGEERIEKGYVLYLAYRKFVAENLLHLHEEETVLLPELQRLYSDQELAAVSNIAYEQMMPKHMVEMVKGLFPYMNKYDRRAFLSNMQVQQPQKFAEAWPAISPLLKNEEQSELEALLLIRS